MQLEIKDVSKIFRNNGSTKVVLDKICFGIEEGEFVTLLGPSGCGKTTLLSIIAGFQKPTEGRVELDGTAVTGPGPNRAFVFQDYALFPWMTVRQNILYPMRQLKVPKHEQEERLGKLLSMAHLEGREHLYPNQISGGMKQRTAVIRALACSPRVLLMDEPLGAVDYQMRQMLQEELEDIWLKGRTTVLMVTHDIDEAVFLSDRVLVMTTAAGKIADDRRITLGRPRKRDEGNYNECKQQLTDILRKSYPGASTGVRGCNSSHTRPSGC